MAIAGARGDVSNGRMRRLGQLLVLVGTAMNAHAACPPAAWDEAALDRLRVAKFALPDNPAREALASALTDCLADPRPQLRDGIAFEALSAWMRAGALPAAQLDAMRRDLTGRLTADDPSGFARPFAALTLAEIARVDRLKPFLEPAARDELLRAAVAYERGVRDYRGFDAMQGWRHGVAHGADLLLQLALNPALDRPALDAIIAAAASQIAPPGEHFYVYGESERLARPIFYVARRGLHDESFWNAWFATLASPAPLLKWDEAFKSQAGLARKQNTQAFVQVLYVMVREGGDAALQQRLLPGLVEALKTLP
jgi:hypothetical protein